MIVTAFPGSALNHPRRLAALWLALAPTSYMTDQ
jgi:hypothetical protein